MSFEQWCLSPVINILGRKMDKYDTDSIRKGVAFHQPKHNQIPLNRAVSSFVRDIIDGEFVPSASSNKGGFSMINYLASKHKMDVPTRSDENNVIESQDTSNHHSYHEEDEIVDKNDRKHLSDCQYKKEEQSRFDSILINEHSENEYDIDDSLHGNSSYSSSFISEESTHYNHDELTGE